MGNHLLVLQANSNPKGQDWVIGDVHGGLTAFKAWMSSLKPGDRGICAGDLVDRGENSPGVIRAIIENNNDPAKAGVYAICGNHELLCLKAINNLGNYIQRIADGSLKLAELMELKTHDFDNYTDCGGEWLFELFVNEVKQGKIRYNASVKGGMEFSDDSEVKMIKDYMSSLPIAIHVKGDFEKGKMPYNVVHADMPVDDLTIQRMIRDNKLTFSPEAIDYATWARVFDARGRNENSVMTLVGHNIVTLVAEHALRLETNAVNLDFRTHHHHSIISVNMTTMRCQWFGLAAKDQIHHGQEEYNEEFVAIKSHLFVMGIIRDFLMDAYTCKNFSDLENKMEDYVNSHFDINRLLDLAIRNNALSDTFLKNELLSENNLELLFHAGLDYQYQFADEVTMEDFVRNADPPLSQAYALIQQEKLYEAILNQDMVGAAYALQNGASVFQVLPDGSTVFDRAADMNCLKGIIQCSVVECDINSVPQGFFLESMRQTDWSAAHVQALLGEEAIDNDVCAEIPRRVFDSLIHRLMPEADKELRSVMLNEFHDFRGSDEARCWVTPADISQLKKDIQTRCDQQYRQYAANDAIIIDLVTRDLSPFYIFQDGKTLKDVVRENGCEEAFRFINQRQFNLAVKENDIDLMIGCIEQGANIFDDPGNVGMVFRKLHEAGFLTDDLFIDHLRDNKIDCFYQLGDGSGNTLLYFLVENSFDEASLIFANEQLAQALIDGEIAPINLCMEIGAALDGNLADGSPVADALLHANYVENWSRLHVLALTGGKLDSSKEIGLIQPDKLSMLLTLFLPEADKSSIEVIVRTLLKHKKIVDGLIPVTPDELVKMREMAMRVTAGLANSAAQLRKSGAFKRENDQSETTGQKANLGADKKM